MSRTIEREEVSLAAKRIIDLWESTRNYLPSGEVGWYRKIHRNDRVGMVATAQGVLSLLRLQASIKQPEQLAETLLQKQRSDGSWAFISNLDDRGVSDATAWVILGLVKLRELPGCAGVNMDQAIRDAIRWMTDAANADGGWGMCANEKTRCYSTAIAVRALSGEPRAERTVRRALQRLVSLQDPVTGGWRDGSDALSVATTGVVLLTLSEAAKSEAGFRESLQRGGRWLQNVAEESQWWMSGVYAHSREEVEVGAGQQRRRVEFASSPRPIAVEALLGVHGCNSPDAVNGFAKMLDAFGDSSWDCATGAIEREPTSWMLFDLSGPIERYREAFDRPGEVIWISGKRLVRHSQAEWGITRFVKRRVRILSVVTASAVTLPVLYYFDLAFSLTAILALVGALTLNVLSNIVSDLLKQWRNRRK